MQIHPTVRKVLAASLLSLFFCQTTWADEANANKAFSPSSTIDLNFSEFSTKISNTDSGNTSGLNNSLQGRIGVQVDPETEVFFSGGYNSTGQNNINLGVKVSPVDSFSLAISGGLESERLTYLSDSYPSTVTYQPLQLFLVNVRPGFYLYQNKNVRLELASNLSIFFPGSNSVYSVPFNARSLSEFNVEKVVSETVTFKTGIFYQNQEHVTNFFNQTQNDVGLSFGIKWRLF
jgi:hypothetical protein